MANAYLNVGGNIENSVAFSVAGDLTLENVHVNINSNTSLPVSPADDGRPELKRLVGEHRRELQALADLFAEIGDRDTPKAALVYSLDSAMNNALLRTFLAAAQTHPQVVTVRHSFWRPSKTDAATLEEMTAALLEPLRALGFASEERRATQQLQDIARQMRRRKTLLVVALEDLDVAPADVLDFLHAWLVEAQHDGGLMVMATLRLHDIPQRGEVRERNVKVAFAQEIAHEHLGKLVQTQDELREFDVHVFLGDCAQDVRQAVWDAGGASSLGVQEVWESWVGEGVVIRQGGHWQFAGDNARVYGNVRDLAMADLEAMLQRREAAYGEAAPWTREATQQLLGIAGLEGATFTAEALAVIYQEEDTFEDAADDVIDFIDDWLWGRGEDEDPIVMKLKAAEELYGRRLSRYTFRHDYARRAWAEYLPNKAGCARAMKDALEKLYGAAMWRIAGTLESLCLMLHEDAEARQYAFARCNLVSDMTLEGRLAALEALSKQLHTEQISYTEQLFAAQVMEVVPQLLGRVHSARLLKLLQVAEPILRSLRWTGEYGSNSYWIGVTHRQLGHADEALLYLHQAYKIGLDHHRQPLQSAALNDIGRVHYAQSRYEAALRYYEQALPINREIGEREDEATTLNNIGLVHHAQSRYEAALRYYEQALAIRREIGDRHGEANTLNSIGGVHHDQRRYEAALSYFEQVLAIERETSDRYGEAATLNNIGSIHDAQSRYEAALGCYEQALPFWREIGEREGEATTLNNIGLVHDAQSRYEVALRYYEQALAIRREIISRAGEATTLNNIGSVHQAQSRYEDAMRYFEQALPIQREIGDRKGEAATLNNIGSVHQAQRRYEEAMRYFEQALPIQREIGDREGEANTLIAMAKSHEALGHAEAGRQCRERAKHLRDDLQRG